MSRPRPKFCVGEEVGVQCDIEPTINIDCTEVIYREYAGTELTHSQTGDVLEPMWIYQTAHIGRKFAPVGIPECYLRKIPPQDRQSFDDCVWQPVKDEAHAP